MRDLFLVIASGCTALLLESLAVSFINWLLKPKGMKRITIIPIDSGCSDIERSLRWHFFRHDTDPFEKENALVILDCGLGDEESEIAKLLCEKRSSCRFCNAAEVNSIVGDDAVCKGIELVLY